MCFCQSRVCLRQVAVGPTLYIYIYDCYYFCFVLYLQQLFLFVCVSEKNPSGPCNGPFVFVRILQAQDPTKVNFQISGSCCSWLVFDSFIGPGILHGMQLCWQVFPFKSHTYFRYLQVAPSNIPSKSKRNERLSNDYVSSWDISRHLPKILYCPKPGHVIALYCVEQKMASLAARLGKTSPDSLPLL